LISFDVQLEISREFMQGQRVSLQAGEVLKDRLAMNVSETATHLRQKPFAIEIK